AGLLVDAASALRWLEAQGIGPARWRLYGESLGSGVATQVAASEAAAGSPVAGVALEAPFTSIAETAQQHYWYVPARWLVRDRFHSLARIGRLEAPLLIVHGRLDRVVPYEMSERLLDAARPPKRLLGIEQGQHVDLLDFPEAAASMTRFLADPGGLGE
ncbi:MAG: alpha/beta hydrolase, partial [Tistlia sp.]